MLESVGSRSKHCSESEDCGKCVSEHPLLIERLLCHSARRGNLDLTKFLTQHTSQLQSGLAAAIRSSNNELVDFLLSKGARVGAPVQSWHRCSHHDDPCPDLYDEDGYDRLKVPCKTTCEDYVITPIRTPLAEAIRSRNNQMLNTFERLGALTRLSDEHHFHAAVLAAVEVGDLSSLKMIVNHASEDNKGWDLTHALAVAIRNDETDAALMLLDAGAGLKDPHHERKHGHPLILALEQSNRRVVDSMLDCDVEMPSIYNSNGKTALEAAAAWEDVELFIDLMRAGAKINEGVRITPLGAAVRTGNKTFVSQMLDLGADLKATLDGPYVVTPLKAAMEVGDYDMVRFLISKGAPPIDICAFLYTMSYDLVGYEILLSEFKTQHPRGLPGFGGRLLAQAIELGSQPLLKSLLSAGADMNSWCEQQLSCVHRSESVTRTSGAYRYRVLGLAVKQRKSRNLELIRELLDRGADTNLIVYDFRSTGSSRRFSIQDTPLLLAIQSKTLEVARLLLEHGAEVNRPARRGVKQTPLQAACETGSYSMVEFLLRKGARVNDAAAERYGGTALQLAAKSGSLKIVSLLLDNGANAFIPSSKVGGRTAFEAAAESGCIDVLGKLWNAVLPLGFSEKECQSAKEFAKQKGHKSCIGFIDFLSGGSSQSFLHR